MVELWSCKTKTQKLHTAHVRDHNTIMLSW